MEKAVVGVIEKFALLPLLNVLDHEPQLLPNLVVRLAEEIRYAGMNIQQRIDRAELVLLRILLILDIRARQGRLLDLPAGNFDRLTLVDAVPAKCSRFQRFPIQQTNQPARSDRPILRGRLVEMRPAHAGLVASHLQPQNGLLWTINFYDHLILYQRRYRCREEIDRRIFMK